MRLLLILGILFGMVFSGGASATTYQPATTFTGDVDLNSHYVTDVAKDAGIGVTVGFTSDCDYVCDGTDDNVQIQQAIDYLSTNSGGGLVCLQCDNYKMASSGQIVIKHNIELRGETTPQFGDDLRFVPTNDAVTAFWIYDTTNPAIIMNSGAKIEKLYFYYPNQVGGSSPTVYPWTIQGYDANTWAVSPIEIRDCCAGMPYQFIDLSNMHSRALIENVWASPLKYGIKIDNCGHASQCINIHFVPAFGGTAISAATFNFINANLEAFIIGKNTVGLLERCYVWNAYKGLQMTAECGKMNIHNCMFDACRHGIIDSGADHVIDGCTIWAHALLYPGPTNSYSANWHAIEIIPHSTQENRVTVTNCELVASDTAVCIHGNCEKVIVTENQIRGYGFKNTGAWCAGVFMLGNDCVITNNNIITEAGYTGTFGVLVAGNNNIVGENNIVGGSKEGILLYGNSNGNVINRNIISNAAADYYIVTTSSDNIINTVHTHLANAGIRNVINGAGRNAGNPASTGNWNGHGYEGVIIRDTTNSLTYVYINGGWVAI